MSFNGYSTFCFYSLVDGHLGGFHVLAIINNVPMNMHIPVFEYLPSILLGIPMSGFAGPYRNSMFNFLRMCHTVFKSSCTILYSFRQCIKVPTSPQPHQYLLLSDFIYTKNVQKRFMKHFIGLFKASQCLSEKEINPIPLC